VLYLIENGESVNSISDLRGKTVYCCQQGANPEYITNYLLSESGLEVGKDVTVDFSYNNPDELATAIATGVVDLAVLPEPKVTATLAQNDKLRRAVSFTEVWEDVSGNVPLIQGVIIARKSFVEENPEEVALFLDEYKASIEFVNANPEDASAMIAESGIIPKAPLALKAIPNCNIAFIAGKEMISPINSFFGVLFDANPASVGGAMPDNGIYFTEK
ncbi:MAG: MqnA/MqnD/SBP family protein, partial [Clostridia bacterium]|nr:MqnA/MqnD/SBP family protein [Clostridia bacterium]